ncbi:hypothetical protein ACWEFJ_34130 [Actinosynnema sp. NPDC004786]
MVEERRAVERGGRPVSEQQEQFEPRWEREDDREVRGPGGTVGPQYVGPDDDGGFGDRESTAIAGEAGSDYLLGPEGAAVHVEDEDGRAVE